MAKKIKKSINIIPFLFFIVLIIQLFVTYCYTNTKRFSIMALLRNTTFVIFVLLGELKIKRATKPTTTFHPA